MKFQGFIGPTYKLDSVNVDCQRCVNLYPEVIESGTGKEGQRLYYKSTPGLKEIFAVGTGPIRMIYASDVMQNALDPALSRTFVASGSEMFKFEYSGTTWTPVKLGDLLTSEGPIEAESIDRNGVSSAMFRDNTANYFYLRFNDGVNPVDEQFIVQAEADDEVPIGSHIAWIDGRAIINKKNTGQFFVGDIDNFGFDLLNFATAEASQDKLLALAALDRNLWLGGSNSFEIWAHTGNSSFPFERIQGGFIEKGILAPYSLRKIESRLFWLGRDKTGEGIVYMAQGFVPQRISTHAVEQAIKGYANPSKARAYTYQSGGHSFYVLNFEEMTWVYDLSTSMWHERAYTRGGVLERHLGDCHSFLAQYSLHLVGDYQSNKVFIFDDKTYTDGADAITRMRVAPHISNGGKRLFYNSLQIDMETGVGLDGSVQGSDPQAMLDWSNDGGHTWSSEVMGSIGKKVGGIGDFKKRVKFNRLGSVYDRVFRLKITDPVSVTILGAELEVEAGAS